ncbi:MAG: hypothetical protein VX278_13055, partial [Myxococcota bacterium]|nr:hypothetical protein [Myxococcota bacterium]
KLVWISQSAHGFSAEFREELAVYLSMNIMLKTADLCLPEYLPELELGPFLQDAFVIVWLSDWRGNKPFAEVLPILQKEIQEPCKGEASMRAQRGIEFHSSWRFEDARTISGDTRRFLDRQRRMISEDSQEDLAIALVEAAGVLQRRFLIHEALSYPSEKVVQTAKRIQKYPAE